MIAPAAILVTRLRYLGDIILCTPVLDALRECFPEASIEFLGCPPHVEVLEGHPAVDRIHRLAGSASLREMAALARTLRARRIEVAIDLFGNPRSALLVAASGARMRVGPHRGLRSRLYTHRRGRPPGDRSALRHHLDKLVPLVGHEVAVRRPRLVVTAEERASVREWVDIARASRVFVVHPGSTWPQKAWPEERWAPLISWLEQRCGGEVLVVEPPGQRGLAARVTAQTHARALPVLGVRELLALLTHADLYVGNDGGFLHAAVALDVPTLGLFGPTEPDIWFPYEAFGPYRVLRGTVDSSHGGAQETASRLRSLELADVSRAVEDVLRAAEERGDA